MPDVFLSYSREDKATARWFAQGFARAGFSVWWDETLKPGEAYDEVTEKALDEAKAVVVLWSKKSVASRWVRAEATQANDNKTLVPVMIEPCKRPIMFELTHTADLTHWKGEPDDVEWQSYLAGVRRFVVRESSGNSDSVSGGPPLASLPRPSSLNGAVRAHPVAAGSLLALVLILVGAGTIWVLTREKSALASQAPEAVETVPADISLAVMPFVDLSENRDQGFLSDGLAEELIDLLTKIPELRVTARSSAFAFRDRAEGVPAVADKLNVSNILEGSVRRSGNRLRVSVQLVQAKTGTSIWSESYDREVKDLFEVQEGIANAVVTALKGHLLVNQTIPAAQRTQNVKAYEEYLLGRQYQDGFALERQLHAKEAFERAVKLDPTFAPAHAGLALAADRIGSITGKLDWFDVAYAESERSLALAPRLTEGYLARGRVRMHRDWDWVGGLADLDAALAIDPNNAELLRTYGALLGVTGRVKEAVAFKKRSVERDPMFSTAWDSLAESLMAIRDYDAARKALDRAQEISPYSDFRLNIRTRLELDAGNVTEALQLARQNPNPDQRDYGLAMAEFSAGNTAAAKAALERLMERAPDSYAAQIAIAFAWQGEKDMAFKWLDRAVDLHDFGLMEIKSNPALDKLRSDPRFDRVLARMHLSR